MDKAWFKEFILKVTESHIDRLLDSNLVTSWEIESLKAASRSGQIKEENGYLILPDDRKWSLMTLNREYLSHLAIYLELINEGNFSAESIKLEHMHMDLVIFAGENAAIAIEVKKTEKDGAALLKKMLAICEAPPLQDHDRGVDALRKVKCLLEIRPNDFWIVTPTMRWKFQLQYTHTGFKLIEFDLENAA